MHLQTDKEFDQNKKKLNKDFDVEMYQANLRGGKAFAAEQKLGEFRKMLLRSKRIEKIKKKRLKPNDLIKKGAKNMNNIVTPKYDIAPEKTEQKSLDPNVGEYFREMFDFVRLKKIKEIKTAFKNTMKNQIKEKRN